MGQEISKMITGTSTNYLDVGTTEELRSKQIFMDSLETLRKWEEERGNDEDDAFEKIR